VSAPVRFSIASAAAGGALFCLGMWIGGRQGVAAPSSKSRQEAPPEAECRGDHDRLKRELAEELSATFRRDLALAMIQHGPPVPASAPAAGDRPSTERSPEIVEIQERAQAQGTMLVDRALSTGQWREEDRDAFRQVWPHLPEEKVADMARRLFKAVEERRVTLAMEGPPF
jgi:hypothetical protein